MGWRAGTCRQQVPACRPVPQSILTETRISCPQQPPHPTTSATGPRAGPQPHPRDPHNPTRMLRRQQAPHHDGRLIAHCPTRSGRPERRTRGWHCGRQDRRATPVGLGKVFVGGSGGSVFAAGRGEWRSGAASGAGELRLAGKRRGEQALYGPAPLALESLWLVRVRPASVAATLPTPHRQFPPLPSPTSMVQARQPDLRDENRCC